MVGKKYFSFLRPLAVALCLEVLTFSVATPQLMAQSFEVSLAFPRLRDRGAPPRTAGGGVRSGPTCIKGNKPLAALAPNNNVVTTVSSNPTLFWYLPKTEAKSAEFLIVDDQGNEVYTTSLAIQGTPGVVSLPLPRTVSLETGKNYMWQLSLVCNPNSRTDDMYLEGLLERTELNSAQKAQLAQAKDPLKQAEVYAEAEVWQETLTILAQLRRNRPNDASVNEAWQELLESVELPAIAGEPLIDCCTVKN